jgi:hypothetical protein
MAAHLALRGKPAQSEEALFVHDDTRSLAYAQPCAKFAGLLFFVDRSAAIGDIPEKLASEKRARDWATGFLDEFGLLPGKGKDERIRLDIEVAATQSEAVRFNGKERRRLKASTEIRSRISVNGIPVSGPRAKVRMIFKAGDRPIMAHVGLWESLSVFDERELVREHDVVRTLRDSLADRRACGTAYDVREVRLAYFADEFRGGPDLLLPYYFIEIESRDPRPPGKESRQGPRQLIRLPAYR